MREKERINRLKLRQDIEREGIGRIQPPPIFGTPVKILDDGISQTLKTVFDDRHDKPHHKENGTLKTSIGGIEKPSFLTDQEFNHLIFEAADGFFFVIEYHTGHIIYVSDSIQLILNQSQADWLNTCILNLVHPDDVEMIWEQVSTQESPNAGRILDLKPCMRTASMGSRRDFLCRMKIGNNQPDAYAVVHCTGYIKNLSPSGVQIEHLVPEDGHESSHCCFVAIGRLQPTNTPNTRDITGSYSLNELNSQHNMERRYTFVDQRSLHHQQEVHLSGPEQGPVSSMVDNVINQHSYGVGPVNLLTSQMIPEGLNYSFPGSSWVYLPVVPWSHHLGGPVSSMVDNGMNQYSYGDTRMIQEGLDYSFPGSSCLYLPVVPWSHHLGDAGQADDSQAWVEYYHSLGMFREAEMIEQQARGNQGGQAGNPVSTSAVPIYNPGISPQVTSRATQPATAVTPAAARAYPAPRQQPQPAQVPYGQPAPYPGYNYAATYGAQQ